MMITKTYASIAAGQVHLRHVAGPADAMPLVMLHASPTSSRSLEPLMEAMGKPCALYAFDTPGNGQSCAPTIAQPSIADYAMMLDEACNVLGLETVAIYGTHTGAHIAIEWALAKQERVAGIILDSVALIPDAERAEYLDRYAPHKAPDDMGGQFHWAWGYMRDQMIFFPHYAKDAEHMRPGGSFDAQLLHELTLDVLNNLETYHQPYEAVFQHEAKAALTRLDLPALILVEGNAPLDPAGDTLHELVRGSQIARDCAGPAGKAAAITAFLKGI